jgi:hypothetical protein
MDHMLFCSRYSGFSALPSPRARAGACVQILTIWFESSAFSRSGFFAGRGNQKHTWRPRSRSEPRTLSDNGTLLLMWRSKGRWAVSGLICWSIRERRMARFPQRSHSGWPAPESPGYLRVRRWPPGAIADCRSARPRQWAESSHPADPDGRTSLAWRTLKDTDSASIQCTNV